MAYFTKGSRDWIHECLNLCQINFQWWLKLLVCCKSNENKEATLPLRFYHCFIQSKASIILYCQQATFTRFLILKWDSIFKAVDKLLKYSSIVSRSYFYWKIGTGCLVKMTIAKQPKTSCFILCSCSLSSKRLQVLNALGKTVALLLRIKMETELYIININKKMPRQTNQCSQLEAYCVKFLSILFGNRQNINSLMSGGGLPLP